MGDKLAALAHYAYTSRQMETVGQIGELLTGLPLHSYQNIGYYYQGLYLKRQGRFSEARSLLEPLVDTIPGSYRGRVILSLAGLAFDSSDYASAFPLYVEAGRIALSKSHSDLFTAIHTQKMVAVLKSIQGNHRGALADLERLFPLVRASSVYDPAVFHDYLNSFAVELTEFGRLEEAQNVCRITLASPFLFAYPEWRETWQDLALRGYKSRSSVPVIQSFLAPKKAKNVLRLPERERPESARRSPFFQPSDVTSLEDWKNKMVKEPNGENGDESNIDEMSDKDILFEIMNLTSEDDITREQLKKILDAVRKITSKKP